MPKIFDDKRRYLYAVYVGHSDTFFGKLICRVKEWYYRIDKWSEGEVLRRYYEATRKEDDYADFSGVESMDRAD